MAAIESPCILVCAIDPATGHCRGCGRTGEEIGGWLAMAPAARRALMAELPSRLSAIAGARPAAGAAR